MMDYSELNKYQLSKRISVLRTKNDLDSAIEVALYSAKKYPDENIFYKLLGDLYFQKKDYLDAGEAYLNFLKRIKDNQTYFHCFTNFWERLIKEVSVEVKQNIQNELVRQFRQNEFSYGIMQKLAELIINNIEYPNEYQLFNNDKNFEKSTQLVKIYENKDNKVELFFLFEYILQSNHSRENKRIDMYIVSVMERYDQYSSALELILLVLENNKDAIAIRTLFRLCRKLDDYSLADAFLLENPETIAKGDFNIQYELVYYFSKKGDDKNLKGALNRIKHSSSSSIPISKTLYNFYLQFGMLDEVDQILQHIDELKKEKPSKVKSKKGIEQEKESEIGIGLKIRDLITEQEHNRQLIAMKDLLKGFSHELGQPITNIRYNIQLYQMKMEMNLDSTESLELLLDDILGQTIRIKMLLSRFAPIVSSKSEEVKFSVLERIQMIFKELESRLLANNIVYRCNGNSELKLYGDMVKFDQVFYNLIGNSIQAIHNTNRKGIITVNVLKKDSKIIIEFSDNGIGIPKEIQYKIFEPFYTTKEKENGETGGEGLGLFIIWNILKMFGGKIVVDDTYQNGAKFDIEIPYRKDEK